MMKDMISTIFFAAGGIMLSYNEFYLGIWSIVLLTVLTGFIKGRFQTTRQDKDNSKTLTSELSSVINLLLICALLANYLIYLGITSNMISLISVAVMFGLMFKLIFHFPSYIIGLSF